MSKRGGFPAPDGGKVAKIGEASFWDDDIDDDCFDALASQALSQVSQDRDASIAPSYSAFKPNVPLCSTQINKFAPTNLKMTELQQMYEEKEGEVSVLRGRLEKVRSAMLEEQNKKQKEFVEKSMLKDKELNSIKSQLQFKNLEIANLKQKINELSKCSAVSSPRKRSTKELNKASAKISEKARVTTSALNFSPDNPLRRKLPGDFFDRIDGEFYLTENKSVSVHIGLRNEQIVPATPVFWKIDDRDLNFDYVAPEMMRILQSDLDSSITDNIDKVICVSLQMLTDLSNYLDVLKSNSQTEDILQMDKFNSGRNVTKCQIGLNAAKTVLFLAVLLPHSKHLSEFILLDKTITFDTKFTDNFSCFKSSKVNHQYLELLTKIVSDIFILRKTEAAVNFLNSVVELLISISIDDNVKDASSYLVSILKFVLYAKPPRDILFKTLIVMRNSSRYDWFLNFLCSRPGKSMYKRDVKRGFYSFNKDSCVLSLFFYLFKSNHSIELENEFETAFDIISFVYNIFAFNPNWVYYTEDNRCYCLDQIFKLTIEVIDKMFKSYERDRIKGGDYSLFFGGAMEVMRFMYFNWGELMDKHLLYFSKYRHLCKLLIVHADELKLDEGIVKDLQKHTENDEATSLSPSRLEEL